MFLFFRFWALVVFERAVVGEDLAIGLPAEGVFELDVHAESEEGVGFPFFEVAAVGDVFFHGGERFGFGEAFAGGGVGADVVHDVEGEEVAGDFDGAGEGPVGLLVVVAEFVEEAPVALSGEGVEIDHAFGGVEVGHDGVAGVHVAGADFDVGGHALGVWAGFVDAGEFGVGVEDFVPEGHECGGIVEGADDRGGDGEDDAVAGEFGPGGGEVADALSPVGEVGLAFDELRGFDGAGDGDGELFFAGGDGGDEIDQAAEGGGEFCGGCGEGEGAGDFGEAGPLFEFPEFVGVAADARGPAFFWRRIRGWRW